MRTSARFLACTLALLAAGVGLSAAGAGEDSAARRVWLHLDDSGELLAHQRRALQAHVTQLWGRYDVHVEWHARLPSGLEWDDLVLIVRVSDESMARQSATAARPSTLGAVMFMPNQDRFLRTIFVSPYALRRLLVRSGRFTEPALVDRIFGQAIGRVVAHELGHIILDMPGHTADGLMKPRFDAQDLVAPAIDHLQVDSADLEPLMQLRTDFAPAEQR
jgi:hypothetical protein